MFQGSFRSAGAIAASTLLASLAGAQTGQFQDAVKPKVIDSLFPVQDVLFHQEDDGSIIVADPTQTLYFESVEQYLASDFFVQNGMRCASNKLVLPAQFGTTGDCSSGNTTTAAEYDPTGSSTVYEIPVVFHVLTRTNGTGNVSDALINSQIDVLNEDFRAIAGSNGGSGTDVRIQFNLVAITRTANNTYYNDGGSYWNELAWDTTEYLNIYSNTAGGNLGYAYVPNGGGVVGNIWDRVVLYWPAVGSPAPYGSPYDLGRSGTHEVGHYLGLYHTFQGGCVSQSGCSNNGDLICDTNPESQPNFSPCNRTTCGSPDPTNNYMDYSDDVCMTEFTPDQANRMRCTLSNWRVDVGNPVGGGQDPPGAASSPSPGNGATSVSTSANLSWNAGSGADSHDVYFGTDATPDAGEFQGNQSGTSFDPGTLAEGTTYYWRIDEVNAYGTTTGPVWSFTTETTGGSTITLSVSTNSSRRWHRATLTWSGASGANVDVYANGELIGTVANNGEVVHRFRNNGPVTVDYQVCETSGSNCSNIATANF